MGSFLQDLQYSLRLWRKNPGFVFAVVATLALGIGANTAIFSVVNGVLLRPLPYDKPGELVRLWRQFGLAGEGASPVTNRDFEVWRDSSQLLQGVAAYSPTEYDVSFGPTLAPERLLGAQSSPDLFTVLGVKPFRGRNFTEAEAAGTEPVALISYSLWRTRFGGQDDALGETFSVNEKPYTVIGIMPPGFQFPLQGEFWFPNTFKSVTVSTGEGGRVERHLSFAMLQVVARVRPGTRLARLQEELQTLTKSGKNDRLEIMSASLGERPVRVQWVLDSIVGKIRPILLLLTGAVGFVLLIACANVANLLLARAAAREKEIAVRATLGAGRWRLIRQLLTESFLLAGAGGLAGVLLALAAVKILLSSPPVEIPRLENVGLDGGVLGFSMGLSLLTGLLFGLAPAWQTSRTDLVRSLKEGGTHSQSGLNLIRRNRFRAALVAVEVAFSLVLLVGAGLLLNSFLRVSFMDPGFKPQNLLAGTPRIDRSRFQRASAGGLQIGTQYTELLERIRALPGVTGAALATFAPPQKATMELAVVAEGQYYSTAEEAPKAPVVHITPGYFRTMAVPLLQGRVFERLDVENEGVVILSELATRRFLPGQEPIGQLLFLGDDVVEVVGVVSNVRQAGLDQDLQPLVYLPTDSGMIEKTITRTVGGRVQTGTMRMIRQMRLLVRAEGDPLALAGPLVAEVEAAGMNLPELQTMDQTLWQSMAQPRFYSLLFGIFAVVALVLAAVGIFGVMSYAVSQSTHEIGIRMALGAQREEIVRMVLQQGMAVSFLGVLAGLAGAFGLTRFLEALLFSVTATDPITFIFVSLLFLAVALAACYLPARRATKVDPMVALRYE